MTLESAPLSPPLTSSPSVTSESPQRNGQNDCRSECRVIHKVPLSLRLKKPNDQYIYDPVMISMGPYHHGKPHLRTMEEVKQEVFRYILLESGEEKSFYYDEIHKRIDEIRSCYIGVTKNVYNDTTLSEMILVDSFFYIYYMKGGVKDTAVHTMEHVSVLLEGSLLIADMNMMENQIPFWVIKLLIGLRFGEEAVEKLIYYHLLHTGLGILPAKCRVDWIDGDEEAEPLHFLEASQRMISVRCTRSSILSSERQSAMTVKWMMKMTEKRRNNYKRIREIISIADEFGCQFHSVTDLKSKGIRFGRSSACWNDIRFTPKLFYGELLVPNLCISPYTKVFLHNIIAFEMVPGAYTDYSGTSYVKFMKALIVNSKDVRELRKKGILSHTLGSDEEVVKLFQEIDTVGTDVDIFKEVKMMIGEHCSNKARTWLAELINTKFKSPWTVMALFATTLLLLLTFLQTYYTMRGA